MSAQRQSSVPLAALLLLSLTWTITRQCFAQAKPPDSVTPSKIPESNGPNKLSNNLGARPADRSTEITTVGCLKGGTDAFFDDSDGYTLTGNDDLLSRYGDQWVRIRGRITKDAPQNLEVISMTRVSEPQNSILDPALRNPSNWQTYSNETLGVRFAFPKQFDPVTYHNDGMFYVQLGFTKTDNVVDLNRSLIPTEIYLPQPYSGCKLTRLQSENPPHSDFHGGAFAVFVNPQITDAATCKRFNAELGEGDLSSRTMNGINYTVINTSSVGMGSGEDFDTFHTFQNGRCFEVDFQMGWTGSAASDISCAFEDADGDALKTLLLSKISFFPPKAATSATVH
jgi:hypothetical protein